MSEGRECEVDVKARLVKWREASGVTCDNLLPTDLKIRICETNDPATVWNKTWAQRRKKDAVKGEDKDAKVASLYVLVPERRTIMKEIMRLTVVKIRD